MTAQDVDALLARGELPQARAMLEGMIARAPADRATLMRLIDVLSAMRDSASAVARARQLVALDGDDLDARFYLAKVLLAHGDIAEANGVIAGLQATVAAASPVFQYVRGNALAAAGDLMGAEAAFADAVMRDGNYADAHFRLALARRQLGKLAEARDAAMRVVNVAPALTDGWMLLAPLQAELGDIDTAANSYRRALALDPSRVEAWYALGALQAETFRFAEARQSLDQVLQRMPQHEAARNLQGFVLAELGETAAARDVLAVEVAPPSAARVLRRALLLPQVYRDADDLQVCRERYAQSLSALAQDSAHWCADPADVLRLSQTNFLLAYQGRDDRELQSRYADLLHGLIARARPDLQDPANLPPSRGARIKVVFVSSFFRQCTIGHYFRSWVEQLDADRFERVVIHTGWQLDEFARGLAHRCDRLLLGRGSALQVAEAIRAQQADVVIYPEIGMGTTNYLLANMRLARVQCAGWGHPVTTGSREIDVFFSCAQMEPEGGAAHYRERLMLLPGIGTSYAQPAAVAGLPRETFGFASDRHLYLCPQSLFKVHPENDAVYLDLMAADEKAVIVFFQASAPAVTRDFADRLSRQMAARGISPRGQIKFLPRMDEAGFRATLSMADVVLDTLHWSGGNTSLDALSVGAPILTLPGAFMRGRQTQAMLRTAGVPELIVGDRSQLVAQATALAADGNAQQWLRQRLLAGREVLFDRAEPVRALADHLIALFESS